MKRLTTIVGVLLLATAGTVNVATAQSFSREPITLLEQPSTYEQQGKHAQAVISHNNALSIDHNLADVRCSLRRTYYPQAAPANNVDCGVRFATEGSPSRLYMPKWEKGLPELNLGLQEFQQAAELHPRADDPHHDRNDSKAQEADILQVILNEAVLQKEPDGEDIETLSFGTNIKLLREDGIWLKVENVTTNNIGWVCRYLVGAKDLIDILRTKSKIPTTVAFIYYSQEYKQYLCSVSGLLHLRSGNLLIPSHVTNFHLKITDNAFLRQSDKFAVRGNALFVIDKNALAMDKISACGKTIVSPKPGSVYYFNEQLEFEILK